MIVPLSGLPIDPNVTLLRGEPTTMLPTGVASASLPYDDTDPRTVPDEFERFV